jgi:geranylgeranyl diphosphate synthase type I
LSGKEGASNGGSADWIDSGDFYETYERYKKEIDAEIARITLIPDAGDAPQESMDRPVAHILKTKGKMLRPFLTLLSCEATAGKPREVLKGAASIEIAHMASLVHDDIIDESDVRRGAESVHKKFGAHEALLTGDFLIFNAYAGTLKLAETLPLERVVESLRNLTDCASEIVRGQYMEYKMRGNLGLSLKDYMEIITLKTGKQFDGACRAGSILGGGSREMTERLGAYGESLGIAFQIKDDILSVAGSADTIFKPPETDLTARLVTLPVILALSKREPKVTERISGIYGRKQLLPEDHSDLERVLRECGAIDESMSICRDYAKKALMHASDLPPSGAKELLMGISMFIVERDS